MEFTLHPVSWRDAEPLLRQVREAVFMREQGVSVELEWDGLDDACHHVLALNDRGLAMACGRITPEAHIGRIAVLKDWRNMQVGTAILEALLVYAKSQHYPEVDLAAQVQALAFYQRLGFVEEGEVFMDANMPHLKMHLALL